MWPCHASGWIRTNRATIGGSRTWLTTEDLSLFPSKTCRREIWYRFRRITWDLLTEMMLDKFRPEIDRVATKCTSFFLGVKGFPVLTVASHSSPCALLRICIPRRTLHHSWTPACISSPTDPTLVFLGSKFVEFQRTCQSPLEATGWRRLL